MKFLIDIFRIRDRVYGTVEITDPVLVELISSPAMRRLKGVDQAGYFEPHFPGTKHSRFEHSVGVCLLLKRYGAPLQEQVAGLIHDVSHSAFSHCIDYVLDAGSPEKHDHQDNVFDAFVRKSEIPSILEKYGMNIDFILDDANFPLKEKKLPDLCADRIDYSLRSARLYGILYDADFFLDFLVVKNGDWVFTDFEHARQYAELFRTLNTKYYAGMPSAIMFQTVGDCMRYALNRHYIDQSDLYATDAVVLAKIHRNLENDAQLRTFFKRMNDRIGFKNDPDDYDHEVVCKSRVVDPFCLDGDKVKRVSEIDTSWEVIVKKESEPKHYFIKFEK